VVVLTISIDELPPIQYTKEVPLIADALNLLADVVPDMI
jgi:hypothetical protein